MTCLILKCIMAYFTVLILKKKNNPTVATKNTCNMYSRDVINVRITRLWFSKFGSGNFPLTNNDDEMSLAIVNTNLLKIGVNW